MSAYAMTWDQSGKKYYETGVDHGVLYKGNNYDQATPWDGLTGVTQSPSGAEANDVYADNIKYVSLRSAETYGATITAYQSPEEFDECDGAAEIADGVKIGQQTRKGFGLSYRTNVGNDTDGQDHGFKLHLVYGCTASPSERNYQTINDSPEPIELSWEITSNPVNVTGYKPTATVEIDSRKANATNLANLMQILYGTAGVYAAFSGDSFDSGTTYYEKNGEDYVVTEDTTPQSGKTYYTQTTAPVGGRLPLPDEVKEIMTAAG